MTAIIFTIAPGTDPARQLAVIGEAAAVAGVASADRITADTEGFPSLARTCKAVLRRGADADVVARDILTLTDIIQVVIPAPGSLPAIMRKDHP